MELEKKSQAVHDDLYTGTKAGPAGRARSATDPTQSKMVLKVDAVGVSEATVGRPRSGTGPKQDKTKLTHGDAAVHEYNGNTGTTIQDRVFKALFQKILPTQEPVVEHAQPGKRSKPAIQRPNFSLPTMSNNFRRFNARIGVVFVFQNKMVRIFSWKTPSHTLSLLAGFTFLCLEPNLLPSLPLIVCLLSIMIPAFYLRHPPPPTTQLTDSYVGQGPPIAPAATIKPAPDMSKAFFRNMRDLQNGMEDFSVIHDQIIHLVAPLTNFSDERLSSALFLSLFATACSVYFLSFLVPWRLLVLFSGWALVCSSHPTAIALISTIDTKSLKRAIRQALGRTQRWIMEDIVLDEVPEVREVEIFEIQRHKQGSEWETWIYSTSPFDSQSPRRISGDRPKGTRFFEDVQAPKGWIWSDKKWSLDLLSHQWVEERMITAVEVETEGERWVYDIGTSDWLEDSGEEDGGRQKDVLSRKGIDSGPATGRVGEWRRRRWTRLVKRKTMRDASEVTK